MRVTHDLKKLLISVLPARSPEPNLDSIKDIVNDAVQLRNDMTKELVIYHPFWLSINARSLNRDSADCQGTLRENAMAVYIFPGFLREFKQENEDSQNVIVTRARVELE